MSTKTSYNYQLLTISYQLLMALMVAFLLSSCSWLSGKDEEKIEAEEVKRPVEEVYEAAMALMDKGRYQAAILDFQEVQRLYPFSPYANKAKVNEAYANFKDGEYDKSIDIADEFISLNPGNEEVEFMYYMKAMAYYDRISDVKRDQEITVKAQNALSDIINRFPEGRYARDGKYKLDLIRDHLAAKEMEIGRYYAKNKNYLAAINRFKNVVKDYDDTQQIEEALYRLTEANMLLGFEEEALKYSKILGYNYPSGKWYKRAYKLMNGAGVEKNSKTFVGRTLDSIGLGREPEVTQPVDIKSVPNLMGDGSWITDDSALQANSQATEASDTVAATVPDVVESVDPKVSAVLAPAPKAAVPSATAPKKTLPKSMQ